MSSTGPLRNLTALVLDPREQRRTFTKQEVQRNAARPGRQPVPRERDPASTRRWRDYFGRKPLSTRGSGPISDGARIGDPRAKTAPFGVSGS